MRVEPPCRSGNEIFQSHAIAEVRNQGDVQHGWQWGAGPGIRPTGGPGLARSARWMPTTNQPTIIRSTVCG